MSKLTFTREQLLDRLEVLADAKADIERRHAALVDEVCELRVALDRLAAIVPGSLVANKDIMK